MAPVVPPKVPALHGSHRGDDTVEAKVPAAQFEQVVATSGVVVEPGEQLAQASEPTAFVYCPAAHGKQAAAPAFVLNAPASHGTQVGLEVFRCASPAAQFTMRSRTLSSRTVQDFSATPLRLPLAQVAWAGLGPPQA